jgi:hypothetical protein
MNIFVEFLESDNFSDYEEYWNVISNNKKFMPHRTKENPKFHAVCDYFFDNFLKETNKTCELTRDEMREVYNKIVPDIPKLDNKCIQNSDFFPQDIEDPLFNNTSPKYFVSQNDLIDQVVLKESSDYEINSDIEEVLYDNKKQKYFVSKNILMAPSFFKDSFKYDYDEDYLTSDYEIHSEDLETDSLSDTENYD